MFKGKIIINTRPEGSEDLIGNALKKLGSTVLAMPLLVINPVQVSQKVLLDIAKNNIYNWLIFTSKNSVNLLFNQLDLQNGISSLPFKTAVFGKRTELALRNKGYEPDLVNLQNSSADLLNDLFPILKTNENVLLVLGNLATDQMKEKLELKFSVERLNVYRTDFVKSVNKELLNQIRKNQYDLILFTSPSGFKSFKHHTQGIINLNKLKIACLGPSTEEIIMAEGLTPLVVAKPSGKDGLLRKIEQLFSIPAL